MLCAFTGVEINSVCSWIHFFSHDTHLQTETPKKRNKMNLVCVSSWNGATIIRRSGFQLQLLSLQVVSPFQFDHPPTAHSTYTSEQELFAAKTRRWKIYFLDFCYCCTSCELNWVEVLLMWVDGRGTKSGSNNSSANVTQVESLLSLRERFSLLDICNKYDFAHPADL